MYYLCCASSCDSEASIDYQTQCHSLPPDTCDDKKTYKRTWLPYVLEKEPSLNMQYAPPSLELCANSLECKCKDLDVHVGEH